MDKLVRFFLIWSFQRKARKKGYTVTCSPKGNVHFAFCGKTAKESLEFCDNGTVMRKGINSLGNVIDIPLLGP